jgi:hypothetical protein
MGAMGAMGVMGVRGVMSGFVTGFTAESMDLLDPMSEPIVGIGGWWGNAANGGAHHVSSWVFPLMGFVNV